MIRTFLSAWTALDARDWTLVCALILLAGGLWPVYRPAAAIVPGLVLLWIALGPAPTSSEPPRLRPQKRDS